MGRILRVLVFLLAVLVGAAWWVTGRLEHTPVTDAVHMFAGVGGNVGVLLTSEGVVVVDTMMFVRQGDAIRARIRELTPQPVVTVLNTHYHFDHTHGNPAFPVGTTVVSTPKTLQHLRDLDGANWETQPAKDLLPNDTFEGTKEIRLGGKTIRALTLGRGHTDGDLVVLFVEDKVLATGDLFFNGRFPNIDLEAGGSVKEWAGTLDKVLALPFEKIVPGHGPVASRAALQRFRDFIGALWIETARVRDRGGSLEDAIALVDLEPYGLRPVWWAPNLNRGFVIRRTWEELTRPGAPRG